MIWCESNHRRVPAKQISSVPLGMRMSCPGPDPSALSCRSWGPVPEHMPGVPRTQTNCLCNEHFMRNSSPQPPSPFSSGLEISKPKTFYPNIERIRQQMLLHNKPACWEEGEKWRSPPSGNSEDWIITGVFVSKITFFLLDSKPLSWGYGQLVQSDFGESTPFHHRKSVSRAARNKPYKTYYCGRRADRRPWRKLAEIRKWGEPTK